jgi:TPR repeat protein
MYALGGICHQRNDHVRAVEWHTKGAKAGLPEAMFSLGCYLDTGEGGMAPDCPAAADWYRRAADAGIGMAATNLGHMHQLGRGRGFMENKHSTDIESTRRVRASV